MRGPRLLTSTESWNDSMLAAPQSAARRAKWASVIPTSMHAKSKPIFTKAYSFGLVSGSSRRNCFSPPSRSGIQSLQLIAKRRDCNVLLWESSLQGKRQPT
jgi:hypothetical protein